MENIKTEGSGSALSSSLTTTPAKVVSESAAKPLSTTQLQPTIQNKSNEAANNSDRKTGE